MASINSRRRDGRTVWLAQVSVKGFKRLSQQFDDFKAAKTWADAEEAALRKLRQTSGISADAAEITLADLAERFLRDPKVKQRVYYSDVARHLAGWVSRYGDHKVRHFGAVQIVDRRDALHATGLTRTTCNRHLASMRRGWHWGQEVGLVDRAAAWPTGVMFDEPRGRTRFVDDEELAALLAAAKAYSPTMYAAIVTSLACGVRQGELLRLTWKDIDFAKSRLTVMESKNGEARTMYLPPNAAAVLRDLKRASVVGASVFLKDDGQPIDKDVLARYWNKVRAAAGLRDFRWHDLRHCCASFLAAGGSSLIEIGSILGHRSASVTLKYAHLTQGKPVTGHDALNAKLSK